MHRMLGARAGRRRRPGSAIIGGLLLFAAFGAAPAGPAATPIEIGVLPTLSTRTILTTYQPLREYLEDKIGQPVTLVTAPDYRTFLDRTQRGEYRYVITAPHFARLAQAEAGYLPMVRLKRDLQAIIVVRAGNSARTLNDLRGKRVSTSDNTAMLTILAMRMLRDSGLEPGNSVSIQTFASLNSAVLAVQHGDSDAAITAQTALNQMPEETRTGLRVIATSSAVPHMVYLANRKESPKDVERMTRILLDFPDDHSRGQRFFQQTGFLGLVRLGPDELNKLDPYVADLKRQLAAP